MAQDLCTLYGRLSEADRSRILSIAVPYAVRRLLEQGRLGAALRLASRFPNYARIDVEKLRYMLDLSNIAHEIVDLINKAKEQAERGEDPSATIQSIINKAEIIEKFAKRIGGDAASQLLEFAKQARITAARILDAYRARERLEELQRVLSSAAKAISGLASALAAGAPPDHVARYVSQIRSAISRLRELAASLRPYSGEAADSAAKAAKQLEWMLKAINVLQSIGIKARQAVAKIRQVEKVDPASGEAYGLVRDAASLMAQAYHEARSVASEAPLDGPLADAVRALRERLLSASREVVEAASSMYLSICEFSRFLCGAFRAGAAGLPLPRPPLLAEVTGTIQDVIHAWESIARRLENMEKQAKNPLEQAAAFLGRVGALTMKHLFAGVVSPFFAALAHMDVVKSLIEGRVDEAFKKEIEILKSMIPVPRDAADAIALAISLGLLGLAVRGIVAKVFEATMPELAVVARLGRTVARKLAGHPRVVIASLEAIPEARRLALAITEGGASNVIKAFEKVLRELGASPEAAAKEAARLAELVRRYLAEGKAAKTLEAIESYVSGKIVVPPFEAAKLGTAISKLARISEAMREYALKATTYEKLNIRSVALSVEALSRLVNLAREARKILAELEELGEVGKKVFGRRYETLVKHLKEFIEKAGDPRIVDEAAKLLQELREVYKRIEESKNLAKKILSKYGVELPPEAERATSVYEVYASAVKAIETRLPSGKAAEALLKLYKEFSERYGKPPEMEKIAVDTILSKLDELLREPAEAALKTIRELKEIVSSPEFATLPGVDLIMKKLSDIEAQLVAQLTPPAVRQTVTRIAELVRDIAPDIANRLLKATKPSEIASTLKELVNRLRKQGFIPKKLEEYVDSLAHQAPWLREVAQMIDETKKAYLVIETGEGYAVIGVPKTAEAAEALRPRRMTYEVTVDGRSYRVTFEKKPMLGATEFIIRLESPDGRWIELRSTVTAQIIGKGRVKYSVTKTIVYDPLLTVDRQALTRMLRDASKLIEHGKLLPKQFFNIVLVDGRPLPEAILPAIIVPQASIPRVAFHPEAFTPPPDDLRSVVGRYGIPLPDRVVRVPDFIIVPVDWTLFTELARRIEPQALVFDTNLFIPVVYVGDYDGFKIVVTPEELVMPVPLAEVAVEAPKPPAERLYVAEEEEIPPEEEGIEEVEIEEEKVEVTPWPPTEAPIPPTPPPPIVPPGTPPRLVPLHSLPGFSVPLVAAARPGRMARVTPEVLVI